MDVANEDGAAAAGPPSDKNSPASSSSSSGSDAAEQNAVWLPDVDSNFIDTGQQLSSVAAGGVQPKSNNRSVTHPSQHERLAGKSAATTTTAEADGRNDSAEYVDVTVPAIVLPAVSAGGGMAAAYGRRVAAAADAAAEEEDEPAGVGAVAADAAAAAVIQTDANHRNGSEYQIYEFV